MSSAPDAVLAAQRLCLVACVGVCLSSLEWLYPWGKLRRALLAARGDTSGRWLSLWQPHGPRALLLARLGCGLAYAALYAGGGASSALLALLATLAGVCSLLLQADEPLGVHVGMDGGEHMLMVCLLCVGTSLLLQTGWAVGAALAFVAFEALLEYGSAGWLKLRSWRGWASGVHLRRMVGTNNYGHPGWVVPLARHPRLAGALSLSVIALEMALPAAPLLQAPYAELLLVAALAFHVGAGAVMGLSAFAWGFGATFPAILYCRDWIVFRGWFG